MGEDGGMVPATWLEREQLEGRAGLAFTLIGNLGDSARRLANPTTARVETD